MLIIQLIIVTFSHFPLRAIFVHIKYASHNHIYIYIYIGAHGAGSLLKIDTNPTSFVKKTAIC